MVSVVAGHVSYTLEHVLRGVHRVVSNVIMTELKIFRAVVRHAYGVVL